MVRCRILLIQLPSVSTWSQFGRGAADPCFLGSFTFSTTLPPLTKKHSEYTIQQFLHKIPFDSIATPRYNIVHGIPPSIYPKFIFKLKRYLVLHMFPVIKFVLWMYLMTKHIALLPIPRAPQSCLSHCTYARGKALQWVRLPKRWSDEFPFINLHWWGQYCPCHFGYMLLMTLKPLNI